MKRLCFPVAALLLAAATLAVPRTSSAIVFVDYSFDETNSTLTVTSPIAASIPPGTMDGHIRVSYSSGAGGEIVDGPASLEILDLDLGLDVHANFLGQPFTVTGPASASLMDPVDGTLTGNQLDFANAPGQFHAFGSIICTGSPCGFVGLASGVPFDFDSTGSVPLPVLTLASLHGTIAGLSFGSGSFAIVATLNLNAEETGRQLPEPASAAFAALGALALLFRARR